MIHLDYNNIGPLEQEYVLRALQKGYTSTACPLVDEFEKAMAEYLGVPAVVATNSGTAALHLALLAWGVGPGDEVIVPALTFIGTANAVSYTGAKPVFVDVDPKTWCIDVEEVDKAITSKTKVVMPVHLYGNPCDMDKLTFMRKDQPFSLISDGAQSLGAIYRNIPVEKWTYACISFNGNKTMTTGGGGMVVCPNSDKEKIDKLARQGKNNDILAYNYRMTGLSAALGLAQLERLDEFLAKKRRINEIYRNELYGLVEFQEATPNSEPSWWMTACLLKDTDYPHTVRDEIEKRHIPLRRVFPPMNCFKRFGCAGNQYPRSFHIYWFGLCLPSSTLNTEKDIMESTRIIKDILKNNYGMTWTIE
jgi:perosamine synthetase